MRTILILLVASLLGLSTYVASGSATTSSPPEVAASRLRVTVVGCTTDVGFVRIALFASKESFLKEPLTAKVLTVHDGVARWEIESLPAGFYALAAAHDRNGNGKTDRNFLGLPKEPYGFSNKARRLVGAPRWHQARFEVHGTEVTVEVDVH